MSYVIGSSHSQLISERE